MAKIKKEKAEKAPVGDTQVTARPLNEEELIQIKSSQRGIWNRPEFANTFKTIADLKVGTGVGIQIDGIPVQKFKLSLGSRVKKTLEGDYRLRMIDEGTVAVYRVS